MKAIKILLVVMAVLCGSSAAQAGGLFKFGPKVGVTVNDLHFNSDMFNSENRAGWTAGAMMEFRVPVIGIGADLSAMYVRRNSRFLTENNLNKNDRDYFEIPLNLRYNFSLPVIGNYVAPYILVGPSVSFLTSKRKFGVDMADDFVATYKNKSVDWALNFGIGIQIVSHLDISARYGLGLTKAVNAVSHTNYGAGIEGKNRYWTISAAYLF